MLIIAARGLARHAPRRSARFGRHHAAGHVRRHPWNIFADPQLWVFDRRGVVATLQAAAVAARRRHRPRHRALAHAQLDHAWVRIPTAWLIEFLRGMPVLLMMLFILLIASTGAFWAVVIALILYNGTLIGEILRAGLVALPRGQREAG